MHKHADNPPVVTIFGAGVAGLTAAHELIDRGFLVQVIEKQRDVYRRGSPQVGGMAATQYARVRANIEDLHQSLLEQPKEPDDTLGKVRTWLLRLFAFNRSFWLQTETPVEMNSCLYSNPEERKPDSPDQTFSERVVDTLLAQRTIYRDSWLWDLVVRSALLGAVTHDPNDAKAPAGPGRSQYDRDRDIERAYKCYETLRAKPTTLDIAEEILEIEHRVIATLEEQRGAQPARQYRPSLPTARHFRQHRDKIEAALQREFLCFRLIPYAQSQSPLLTAQAMAKLRAWEAHFKDSGFHYNLITEEDPNKILVREMRMPEALPEGQETWLELEIIEQRLPGEHGFRFFPSYYRHIDDTMKRIPLVDCCGEKRGTAYDNFRATTVEAIGLSREDREKKHLRHLEHTEPVEIDRTRAPSLDAMRRRSMRFLDLLGCTRKDAALFAARLLRFMTSSPKRRRDEYQDMSWADFVGTQEGRKRKALSYSRAMRDQIEASAQCILALSAAEADARTYGDATVQLMMDMLSADGTKTDRTLNAPSSDAWLEPWREHLERRGARFFSGQLDKIELTREGELIPRITLFRKLSENGYLLLEHSAVENRADLPPKERHLGNAPDFYVLALDMHQTQKVLGTVECGRDTAPDFAAFKDFFKKTETERKPCHNGDTQGALKQMTGVQFFFEAKTSIGKGHIYFPYSEWGLSCISQSEFWSERGGFSDGYLAVLSVDISDLRDKEERGRGFRAKLGQGRRKWTDDDKRLWTPDVMTTHPGERAYKILQDKTERRHGDDRFGRWMVAREVWAQLKDRIGCKDQLAQPRVFHVDRNIDIAEDGTLKNSSPYLATLPGMWNSRPGVRPNGDIEYQMNFDRWVMCGTHMGTHTRMTTMESANESARHAVKAILRRLDEAAPAIEPRSMMIDAAIWSYIDPTEETKYNGASSTRRYDPPDVWNPEDKEPEDFDALRRLDHKLAELNLPHWMDICEFDRRLELALEMAELAENDARSLAGMNEHGQAMFKSAMSGLEVSLKEALGNDYKLGPTMQRIIDLTRGFVWDP